MEAGGRDRVERKIIKGDDTGKLGDKIERKEEETWKLGNMDEWEEKE